MANITPVDNWSDIPQIEQTDYVLGGEGQIANQQAQALANRTENLKNTVTSNKTTQDNKNDSIDAAINDLNTNKVNKSDIVNNATTTASGKVLDARMGKTLNDTITSNYNTLNTNKVNKSDVVNNYTTTTSGKVLDARVGVSLKALIDGKQPSGSYVLTSNVVNVLNTTVAGKVLDGRMGKTLNDAIVSNYNTLNTNKINKSDIVTNYTTNNTSKVLAASVGVSLKALIDTKINTSNIVDNLTTNDATKVLSAKQGYLLNQKIVANVPTGTILPFIGNTLPSGFLWCNGANNLSRTTYSALYSVIGTRFGNSSSTTFGVPNLEGRFLEGTNSNLSNNGYVAQGLPNIVAGGIPSWDYEAPSGAFYPTSSSFVRNPKSGGGADATYFRPGYFDASRCSSIYGSSTKVQPLSMKVRYIIKY